MRAWIRVMMCATAWLAAAAPAVPQTRASVPALGGPALQGFSVVLVLGDMQGSTTSGNVPAAASRALSDMKDFLPYKSYRLLDTAWMLGSSPMRAAASRLRGSDNQDYEVSIDAEAAARTVPSSSAVSVRFHLQEAGAGPEATGSADRARRFDQLEARRAELERIRATMEREAVELAKKLGERHPAIVSAEIGLQHVRAQLAELESQSRPLSGSTKIIDTSFTMQIGETVVVGTSRVRGNTALIAVLTAVPRRAK